MRTGSREVDREVGQGREGFMKRDGEGEGNGRRE